MRGVLLRDLRVRWDECPYEIHKRPPFAAHSFDGDDRFSVVGSTRVSVLHGWYGPRELAELFAAVLTGDEAEQPAIGPVVN